DENFDSTPQTDELINSFNLSSLASGDSVSQNFNLGSFSAGNLQLIAVVEFNQDEDITNNQLTQEFIINEPPPAFNAIVVNEIMYAPSTGEPAWVEIYNQTDQTYNLQNWQFADAANTSLITTEAISISPGEFIVLANSCFRF
ncbi:MAG: lamin tail domain-containing protein, partial [Melioribacteraceae bacterium]|nr:lamin tail domain-containing protein [Melioribacteraceae bacterium]